MASSVNVVPSLGYGVLFTQTGPSSGYDAIDDRRKSHPFASEGILAAGAYRVSQRAAGANLSVDVAANVAASNGASALVQGDSITSQGIYTIVAHTAVANLDIGAANATNPRNDLIVLRVLDDAHDVGGLNGARVEVITGTATSGAALTDAFGVNGTPALPASCLPLAVVNVPATDTTISDAQIDDRRPLATQSVGGGKSIIATSESRTNTAYGLLATPDRVRGIVLPTDGLIAVGYKATWRESVNGAARAAIFLGANQLKIAGDSSTSPQTQAAATKAAAGAGTDYSLASFPLGLMSNSSNGYTGDVTTGQAIGWGGTTGSGLTWEQAANVIEMGDGGDGGPVYIFAAAGTYDVSVQFKATSGTVTASNRRLWVWTQAFG